MLTDLGVLDRAERNLAAGVILDGLDKLRVLTLDLAQLKAELAGLEVAAGQDLGDPNLVGDAGLGGLSGVGVHKFSLARGHLHLSAERALLVGRYRYGDLRNVLAVGDSVDDLTSVLLADLINVRSGLGVFNLAEIDGFVALGHSYGRGVGHRGIVVGRRGELKLKRIRIRPLAALEHLGQTKVSLGIHRCRLGCKAKDNLAIVAQVRMHVRGSRNGGKVIPPGVKHVARGLGLVAVRLHIVLGGMQLVDIGQARGSLIKGPIAVIFDQSAVVAGDLVPLKLHNGIIVLRLAVCAHRHKLVFVVIDVVALRLYRRALGAFPVRVDRRDFLEVIVAVGIGGLKLGDNIAQLAARPLVG